MIGERLGGWQVVGVLGEGTQGTVYAARHVELHREAALKVLLPRLARDAVRVERFLDEARAASSIRHGSVVEVFDCGRADGRVYIAMEQLAGETLDARLRRSPPELPEAMAIIREIAVGLAAAHAAGVVHRDLKPANVFLARAGGAVTVKLLDFGIAKLAPGLRASGTLTGAGAYGTPPYMPPEQWAGVAEVDDRADSYALGCLVHELVTGTPPFGFSGATELARAHDDEEPPRLSEGCPDVPAELDDIVARLLAKDPRARPACADIVAVIDRCAEVAPIAPPPMSHAASAKTALEPIAGWRARAWRGVLLAPLWTVAAVACTIGTMLLSTAILTGVGDSYGMQPNWGFTYVVLVPLIVALALRTVQRAHAVLAGSASVRAAGRRLGSAFVGFGTVFAALSVATSVSETLHRKPVPGLWWSDSRMMGVLGATCQGLLIALILMFIVYCLGWAHLMSQLVRDEGSPPDGVDEPIALALVTATLAQTSMYLSSVEHIAEDRGMRILPLLAPSTDMFDLGPGHYQAATTMLGSMLVSGFMLAAGIVLWRAFRSRWPLRVGPAALAALLVAIPLGTLFFRFGPFVLAAALLLLLAPRHAAERSW